MHPYPCSSCLHVFTALHWNLKKTITGGLAAAGIMARNESFLMVVGPMAMTIGAALACVTGLSMYPHGSEVGNLLGDMNMNVLFVLFSLTLLYDVHNMVKVREVEMHEDIPGHTI